MAACLAGTLAHAQDSGTLIPYSGTLPGFGSGKTALKAGAYQVTFAIYTATTGNSSVWQETQSVQADSAGNYTVLLGSVSLFNNSSISAIFQTGSFRYVGCTFVSGNTTYTLTRTLMTADAFAVKAAVSQKLAAVSPYSEKSIVDIEIA